MARSDLTDDEEAAQSDDGDGGYNATGPAPDRWNNPDGPGRVSPRECIGNAWAALDQAYGSSVAPWQFIAEAVDWQRRALEQMVPAADPAPDA